MLTAIAVALGIVLASLIIVPLFATSLLLNQHFEQPQHDPADFGLSPQQVERITLSTDDGLDLAAWRVLADAGSGEGAADGTGAADTGGDVDGDPANTKQPPHGTVIILSGIQNPSVTAFFGYGRMLADAGWDTLLVEMRARSLSEGTTIGLGYTEWLDVKAGVDYLAADPRTDASDQPIIAMGTSAGGATVLTAAGEVPRIDGVIAISAFSTFTDAYIDNAANMGFPRSLGNASRPFMHLNLGMRFGFDATQRTPIAAVSKLGDRPLLLMQSTDDREVPYAHFERLHDAATAADVPLTIFVREGNYHFVVYSHLLENPEQDPEFTSALLDFLTQFED